MMVNQYMTISEVRDYLKLSKLKVYELVHSKGFPLIKIGARTYRVNKYDLDRYLEDKKISY